MDNQNEDGANGNETPGARVTRQTRDILAALDASTLDAFCSIRSSLPALTDPEVAAWLAATPLGGLPIAVKEIIDVADEVCARGCDAFEHRVPMESADIVQKLEALGAQVVGLTRSTELAIAGSTTTSNPYAKNRSPGASSSGSAAAVGGGLVSFALGSQTIGSTIRPAAYCGIVGFKPSHGVVPLHGVMPLSPTLDHPGFLANSVSQLVAVTSLLDNRFLPKTGTQFRFRFADHWFTDPLESSVSDGIARFRASMETAGYECCDWSVDKQVASIEARVGDTILVHEMAEHWFDLLHSHADISEELRDLLRRGKTVTAAEYADALTKRESIMDAVQASLEAHDIVVAPAVTGPPPLKQDGTGSRDPQRLWTLAGMPALSLPIGSHAGLPLAVQLIAQPSMDHTVLDAALAAERILTADSGVSGIGPQA